MADGGSRLRGIATAGALVASAYLAARRFGRRAAARARAERRFGVLMQNSSDVIAVIRADGVVDYVSPSIKKITGLGPGERVGRSAFDMVHPGDLEGVRADMADLLRRPGGTATGEFRMLRADGGVRHVEAVAVNRVDDPDVGGIVVNYRDVTERRRAEEDRLKLAAIVGSSEDAITSGDLRGTVTSWNPGAERLYGLSAREAVGRPVREATKPLDPETIPQNIALVERGKTVGPFDAVHHDRLGRALSVSVTLSPIRTPGGGVTGVAAVTRDVSERDEAERALRASEKRFRTVFENAPLGVALVDLRGRFRRANGVLYEMFGYPEEELLNMTTADVTHPEDLHKSVFREGRIVESDIGMRTREKRYVRKDGGTVWTLSSISLVRDAGGAPSHFVALYQDITERRSAEDRVRFQAQLLEQVQAGVIATDVEGTVIHWNTHAERLYGWSRGEALGREAKDLVVGPAEAGVAREIMARLRDGGSWEGEFAARRRDGSVFPAYVSASPVRDAEGRAIGIVGVSTDLTERKRAEETARQSEERYRAVVERTTDGIFLADFATKRVLETNGALQGMLGYTAGELSGMSVYDFIVDEPENIDRNARRVLDERSLLLGERRYRRKDGSFLHVESSVTRIPHAGGEVSCCIVRDITARKRAEDEIREANRRLGELAVLKADFTAMVAHELDTPLAVIRGYADMISTGSLDAEGVERALARIQSETDVLNALVADVRAAANVERQDFAVDPCPVRADDLLGDAAAFARSLPGGHELVVRAGVAGAVRADRYRIGQVLRNLLSNAAKYSPDGAPIGLRVLAGQEGRVRFEVFDRGGGISPEDAARIFEKFGRGRDGRDQKGLGLGLYLSRRILQAHGGDLTFRPDPEGGSVFGFELEAEG